MKIQSLTLVTTKDCNFSCAYCYQKKQKINMPFAAAEQALVFFCPS